MCFALLAPLGFLLTADLRWSLLAPLPVSRGLGAHAIPAVFRAVLMTVLGVPYQLATMFTQTELHGIDPPVRRVESLAYPSGVVLLAIGRLLDVADVARLGDLLVIGSVAAFTMVLACGLYETHVDWTPILSRLPMCSAC